MTSVVADNRETSNGPPSQATTALLKPPLLLIVSFASRVPQLPLKPVVPVCLKRIDHSLQFPRERKQRAMLDLANLKIQRLQIEKSGGHYATKAVIVKRENPSLNVTTL